MKNGKTQAHQTARRLLLIACVAALAVAFTISPPQPVYAGGDIVPPPLPPDLQPVPPGNKVFLKGAAVGTQNYICLPCPNATTPDAMCPDASGFAWTFFGPQATLLNDDNKQIITHFLSPNPVESDTARATWQHSRDTSTVWAMQIDSSSDPKFVESGAIPWLLLRVVGTEPGPTDGDRLTKTTFIQRLNTSGGIAPSTECAKSTVGEKAFESYTADYFFYKAVKSK